MGWETALKERKRDEDERRNGEGSFRFLLKSDPFIHRSRYSTPPPLPSCSSTLLPLPSLYRSPADALPSIPFIRMCVALRPPADCLQIALLPLLHSSTSSIARFHSSTSSVAFTPASADVFLPDKSVLLYAHLQIVRRLPCSRSSTPPTLPSRYSTPPPHPSLCRPLRIPFLPTHSSGYVLHYPSSPTPLLFHSSRRKAGKR